ncbi:MAG: class I SAM-dependent rRNA methyltransferase [Spirochaetes bacterium]|nr:class I SAM-dependent rRNA methyltransferase [Spirochaetota bacterium]
MKSVANVWLKPREEDRILRGHPWIYDNEIASVDPADPPPGTEVLVRGSRGRLLGSGLWSPVSKIRVRLHSTADRRCDAAFLRETIERSAARRERFRDIARDSCRLVFGEADGLPGLIVDSFVAPGGSGSPEAGGGRYLSVQILSAGMEARREAIVAVLEDLFRPAGILERSDAPVRGLEGLGEAVGTLAGTVPDRVLIEENGLLFAVDLAGGQKTGWFLDQRDNRAAAAAYAPNVRVLDVFCNAGGFALCAVKAGATSVTAIDISADAIAQVRANAALNGMERRVETAAANAFDYLRELGASNERYGMIVLDPPAFAKNRAALQGARRGYKEINLRALKLLEPGGILVSCSCSYWLDRDEFRGILGEAAADARIRLHLLENRTQSRDHPILLGYPESEYLKCLIAERE